MYSNVASAFPTNAIFQLIETNCRYHMSSPGIITKRSALTINFSYTKFSQLRESNDLSVQHTSLYVCMAASYYNDNLIENGPT